MMFLDKSSIAYRFLMGKIGVICHPSQVKTPLPMPGYENLPSRGVKLWQTLHHSTTKSISQPG
jgi:hypothetical protein